MPFKDKAKRQEYQKEYREKTKELQKEYQRKYRKLKADVLAKYKKDWYSNKRQDKILKQYGVTLDFVYSLIEAQENKCKLCGVPFSEKKKPYIDHCHNHGHVRGILCMNCNTGLGHFKDDYKILLKAARYVR